MTSVASVILSPSALSGPQGLAPRRGRISTPVARRLASLKLTHYDAAHELDPWGPLLAPPPRPDLREGHGCPHYTKRRNPLWSCHAQTSSRPGSPRPDRGTSRVRLRIDVLL